MTQKRLILATTHLDIHNERFSVGALKMMVEQSNQKVIPLGYEHDPRVPPLGRIIRTELVEVGDGEFAVEGIAEFFDEDFSNLADLGSREIPIGTYRENEFKIVLDRTFRDSESQKDIEELARILKNAPTQEEIKKSAEPISVLTIAGGFVLGNILSGFLKQIGSDAYKALKEKLKEIFNKSKQNGEDKLFTFDTTITNGEKSVNIEVIITNPSVDEIQYFFDEGIKQLDEILPRHFENDHGFARIVFEYKNGKLQVKFGVLKSGIPVKM